MFPYEVSQKLVISGQFIEHYTYSKSYWVGFPRLRSFHVSFKRKKTEFEQLSIREDNVRRTRIKIRRLVNSNQDLTKFMTLTYNRSVLNLDESNVFFKNFIKRIKRIYPDFKYLAVPEFQKDQDYYGRLKVGGGSVHYHLLCNLPFIDNDQLEAIWGNGWAFIRKVDSVDNLGAYVCKYLCKENFDKRYFRKNKFFYSYNLFRPIIVDKIKQVSAILENLPFSISSFAKEVFNFSFYSDFLGDINYKQYKILPELDIFESVVDYF